MIVNVWDSIKDIVKKVPDITNSLKELAQDPSFQQHMGQAGAIAGLCVVGIDIVNKIKSDLQTPEKRAFASVLKLVFECTQEVIPNSNEIKLKDIKTEELVNELFEIFTQTGYSWDLDLPSHPIIDRYRKHLSYFITSSPNHIDQTDFFIKFNILLENRAIADPDIKEFYNRSQLNELGDDLRQYLEMVRSMKDDLNPVDHKSYMDYYVENKAVLVSKETWYEEDKDIPFDKQWTVENFLQGKEHWYIIIGSPFGIGKTSLAKKIAVDYATRYLNEPAVVHVPVFVSLRDKLNNVYYDNNLDYVLDFIIAPETSKNRKILLICDGLDEYGDNNDIKSLFEKFEIKHNKELHNMRLIITTRLQTDFPNILGIKEYVRLLPFDPIQVDEFFQKYYFPKTPQIKFQDIKKYGLKEDDIFNPLFCWILLGIQSEFDLNALENIINPNTKRSLIYQQFIHSTIIGKHRKIGGNENFDSEYELEYNIQKEKKILRKIAPLKMMYGNKLTKQILTDELLKFDDVLITLEDKIIQDILSLILSSYFYLTSSTPHSKIEFIHASFKEYLLAEYFIESLFLDKPYRLNVGIPSYETMLFLNGLLDLLVENEKNKSSSPFPFQSEINRFLKSLLPSPEESEEVKISQINSKLVDNAQNSFKEEQIVFDIKNKVQENEFWYNVVLPFSKYPQLWIQQWILLNMLNKLVTKINIDKKVLADFIVKTSHTLGDFPKSLCRIDLSSENLSYANLSGANLSYANLSNTKLSYANLSGANLSYANLSGANLSGTNLFDAHLSYANLSGAHLSGANLIADFSYANFSSPSANFSGAYLKWANLSHANLTDVFFRDTVFSNANFSYANLSGADLSYAQIRGDFSSADLSHAKLSYSDLTTVWFPNAKFYKTDLSYAELGVTNLYGAKFYEADLSNAILEGSLLRNARLEATNLSGANLSHAIILSFETFHDITVSNTDFSDAIIEDAQLITYLKEKGAINIPTITKDKSDLYEKLKAMGFDEKSIEIISSESSLS